MIEYALIGFICFCLGVYIGAKWGLSDDVQWQIERDLSTEKRGRH